MRRLKLPKVYIKEEDGYHRVYVELEISTIHRLHSEKLNHDNAKRLMKQLSQDFGGSLSC